MTPAQLSVRRFVSWPINATNNASRCVVVAGITLAIVNSILIVDEDEAEEIPHSLNREETGSTCMSVT